MPISSTRSSTMLTRTISRSSWARRVAALATSRPNLGLPYTGPTASLVAPTQFQSGTGATFGIAFLSDLEVYLFLTAAQGDTRSNVLQAPKVTTMNGAAATVFSNVVQYYVAGLTPIIGPGAVAYTPQIGSCSQRCDHDRHARSSRPTAATCE